MRTTLILIFFVALLVGCEERSTNVAVPADVEPNKPMIRSISINSSNEYFGIELNGDNAFLSQEIGAELIEISYREGLGLLEDFYQIPGIENYRGKESDNRQTSIHFLVNVFDDMPERYSEGWVDYVIPKARVPSDPELSAWFERMRAVKKTGERRR